MSSTQSIIEAALARARTRTSWNERLTHWERPASDTEEAKIQRAADAACRIVNGNATLLAENVQIRPQGSYFNNTNVRLEADMDLRVQLPGIVVETADDVDYASVFRSEGYSDTGRALVGIADLVRGELAADCRRRFGAHNVMVGKKAVTVDGLSGSRADVDLVPAFHLHWVSRDGLGGLDVTKGVVIVSADGTRTFNFPEQHHANGKAKRARTQHRFKKVVRMLKRLNCELEEHGYIDKRVPSFLVECLVYIVEDHHFLMDEERYDRLIRIVRRIRDRLYDAEWVATATEVNGVKYLFRPNQAWTLRQAQTFVESALTRLEA